MVWDSSLATCPGLCSVFSTVESSPKFIAPEFPVSLVKVTHTLCMPVLPLWLLQPEPGLDPGAVLRYISCQGNAKLRLLLMKQQCLTGFQRQNTVVILTLATRKEKWTPFIWRAGTFEQRSPFHCRAYVGSRAISYSCPWHRLKLCRMNKWALRTGKLKPDAPEPGHSGSG